jgi:uncharacterized membrane protein YraQ (UPF0718 family)
MADALLRHLIYFWYYFSIQLEQIFGYWALGMVLGSLISVFGKEKINQMFAALREKKLGILGVIPASLLGIASPLCMYGTIPIAASFAEKGMEEDWLAAFMMGSILLNPQLLFYSAALGVPALIIRFVCCFICGVAAGIAVRFLFKKKKFFNFSGFSGEEPRFANAAPHSGPAGLTASADLSDLCTAQHNCPDEVSAPADHCTAQPDGSAEVTAPASRDIDPNLFLRFLKNLGRNIKATALYFLIGIVLSALFQCYVPPEGFARLFGGNRGFGVLMAATIGVPLYMCGGGTIPLLQTWLQHGMTMGSAAAFMITGPATKITNLGALKIVLGIKHFLFYLLFVVVFALLSGLIINLFT